jgi:hypothetical protein
MDHDFEKQRNETLWVWNDLSTKKNLPKSATVDFQFVPSSPAADWDLFELQLRAAGYRCERYSDERTLEASIGPIDLSADAIWQREFAATQIAINCGFRPDGWGFLVTPPVAVR